MGDLGLNGEVDDTRDIAELLAEQVEFANVIVVNKADLVDDADVEGLKALVKELNPGAKVVAAEHGKVALETMAREELGLDPSELGAPWGAAISSFFAFVGGAVVPIIPYLLEAGDSATWISSLLSAGALLALAIGAVEHYGGSSLARAGGFWSTN